MTIGNAEHTSAEGIAGAMAMSRSAMAAFRCTLVARTTGVLMHCLCAAALA